MYFHRAGVTRCPALSSCYIELGIAGMASPRPERMRSCSVVFGCLRWTMVGPWLSLLRRPRPVQARGYRHCPADGSDIGRRQHPHAASSSSPGGTTERMPGPSFAVPAAPVPLEPWRCGRGSHDCQRRTRCPRFWNGVGHRTHQAVIRPSRASQLPVPAGHRQCWQGSEV